MSDRYAFIDEALHAREKDHQFRSLTSYIPFGAGIMDAENEKEYINFSSNDYLGLSRHPEVVERAQEYARQYGAGSTASRLISGTFDIHTKLEDTLASTLDREAALVFNSGFQANSSILSTVTNRHSLILADKLSHNSLLQGALLSQADFQRFRHNDMDHLELLLKKARKKDYNRIWIVTETVFSMDGDRSPLKETATLAKQFDALLFVDDAHGVGVWGQDGLGLAKDTPQVDILLGTCGKAFGSFGAYAACSQKMKDYLINFCPGFIYTTALPPAVIGATQAALELIPALNDERENYHRKIISFRKKVNELGLDTGPSSTQIIPVIIGDEKKTLELADYLKQRGLLATAIRPPTVPEQSARIRLTLSLSHSSDDINLLLDALKSWKHA